MKNWRNELFAWLLMLSGLGTILLLKKKKVQRKIRIWQDLTSLVLIVISL